MYVYFLCEGFYDITQKQDLSSVYSLKQLRATFIYDNKKIKIKFKNSNYITHAVVFIQHTTKSMMSGPRSLTLRFRQLSRDLIL